VHEDVVAILKHPDVFRRGAVLLQDGQHVNEGLQTRWDEGVVRTLTLVNTYTK
jgi:hypothetical protein